MKTSKEEYTQYFSDVRGMKKEEAEKQASLSVMLHESLKKGETMFVYIKKDGQLREARGTLAESKLSTMKFKHESAGGRIGYMPYYDLDKDAWRCVDCERIVSVACAGSK